MVWSHLFIHHSSLSLSNIIIFDFGCSIISYGEKRCFVSSSGVNYDASRRLPSCQENCFHSRSALTDSHKIY